MRIHSSRGSVQAWTKYFYLWFQNVLTELQHHYEDEKQALLASLRDQESRLAAERHRQLELARLRKDQKTFEKQDKFDSAALLLSLAEEQEKNLEAKWVDFLS